MSGIYTKVQADRLLFLMGLLLEWEEREFQKGIQKLEKTAVPAAAQSKAVSFLTYLGSWTFTHRDYLYARILDGGYLASRWDEEHCYPSQARHTWGGGRMLPKGLNDLDRERHFMKREGLLVFGPPRSGWYGLTQTGKNRLLLMCHDVVSGCVYAPMSARAKQEAVRVWHEYGRTAAA